MLTETRVYIARYLCPDGHCIMTASGEADAEEPDVKEIDQLVEASLNKLIEDGAVTPWCGICGAARETWHIDLTRTQYRTIAEAGPHLIELARQNVWAGQIPGGPGKALDG